MPYSPSDLNFERTGSGPPAILLHGCPATHTLWRPLVERLAGARSIYALDLPGFGASPFPDDPQQLSLRNLAQLVLRFADLHNLDRFDLIGHSFGGALAATIADAAPERIRSLTLITPMAPTLPPAARLARSPLARNVLSPLWKIAPRTLRQLATIAGVRANYGPAYDRSRAEELAREMNRDDALANACALVTEVESAEYAAAIERLGQRREPPVLLIGAGRDRVVPYSHFITLRSQLPHAADRVFDDGVHVIHWQHPDEVARVIEEFLTTRVGL
jgi:pimeloyl-ACP methyl ester carboxylesterase